MELKKLRQHAELADTAAEWFHSKWGIDISAYSESIADCIAKKTAVPQWYIATEGEKIVGCLGVIENDFHERKDLSPNICAVFVEEAFRGRGIAGALLNLACDDMAEMGIKTLYLVTDHTAFYERYGWHFYCNVKSDGEENFSRMYVKEHL